MSIPMLQSCQCQKILSYVRAGADPEVAALAVGANMEQFREAIRHARNNANPAQGDEGGLPFECSTMGLGNVDLQRFAWEVLQTWAQARLSADIRMFREKPLEWIRSGPGKACRTGNWSPQASKPKEPKTQTPGASPKGPKGKREKAQRGEKNSPSEGMSP